MLTAIFVAMQIDMLITHKKYTTQTKDMSPYQYLPRIVQRLHKTRFLTDDISHGNTKYMVCMLASTAECYLTHHFLIIIFLFFLMRFLGSLYVGKSTYVLLN